MSHNQRRARRGRNSLCTLKSRQYMRIVASFSRKNCSLSGRRRRRASERHSGRKRCGNMRRREAGQHKGEQCDKRVALRSSFLRSQLVTMRGEILKSIVSTTRRRAATCAIRYTRDKEIAPATARGWPRLLSIDNDRRSMET